MYIAVMPNEKFCALVALVSKWSKCNKDYVYESDLQDDAPDYVKSALKELKTLQKELDEKGICV